MTALQDAQDGEAGAGPSGRLDALLRRELEPRTATKLERQLGLRTVRDLVEYAPRRWLHVRDLTRIADLVDDEMVTIIAEVARVSSRRMRERKGSLTQIDVTDGEQQLSLTFFNRRGLDKALPVGSRALFSGTVSRHRGRRQLVQPEFTVLPRQVPEGGDPGLPGDGDTLDRVGDGTPGGEGNRLIAVYPATKSVRSEVVAGAVRPIVETLRPADVPDPLPASVRRSEHLPERHAALRQLHLPRSEAERDAALARLRFEEALVLQTALLRRRRAVRERAAVVRRPGGDGILAAFDARLPFPLTAGQRRVGDEITADLASGAPMQRLLQGDVGTGKTLVAVRAMLSVVDAGGQAALLAPTEVLAAQHHRTVTETLGELGRAGTLDGDPRGTRVALLTGSAPTAVRRRALADIASGQAGIVVGTHALIGDRVDFADLGLVVVDEQHRFGVEQRDALRTTAARGDRAVPHLLVMTATPIPRTVAVVAFGDLDVSTLDEVPAGRADVTTHVVAVAEHPRWLERVWSRVREEADAGRQVFVVCPRIGDDGTETAGDTAGRRAGVPAGAPPEDAGEDADAQAAGVLATLAALRADATVAGLRIEPLHGRQPPDAKEATMRAFAAGDVDVLVSTTVVEVGVDVPNAAVMVVLDADRFGVSQLHQLRGRVGRGAVPGLCLLVTEAPPGAPARERLDAVAATRDGMELARLDLEQRREGDILGAAQSGRRSSLRLLRVLRDGPVIERARDVARELVAADPELSSQPELRSAVDRLAEGEQEEYLDRA